MEVTASAASTLAIPITILTLTSFVVLRRGLAILTQGVQYEEESEEEFVEGEEELLPTPEPLGGALAPPKRNLRAYEAPHFLHDSSMRVSRLAQASFPFDKQRYELPLDLDARSLRAKLIDADAAKRRAMTRLAELERETETLKRRCAELEGKVVADRKVASENIHSLGKLMTDSLQTLGLSQRLLVSIAMPQLKYRGRGVMWKT